jgi:hypothetical protein|tara:strand:+ start:551 stop:862 length:312 start_codon:yes stop_codon:yes gene_type:complete
VGSGLPCSSIGPVELWFNGGLVGSKSINNVSIISAILIWEEEIFTIPSWNQIEICWGSWLNFTLAVFNVPVFWDTTEVTSVGNVVGIVINIEWESLNGHHLVV